MRHMRRAVYVQEYSVVCALGGATARVRDNLLSHDPPSVSSRSPIIGGRIVPTGALTIELADGFAELETADSRCNKIADHCLSELKIAIANHIENVGASRVAVIIGTCTSGVHEGEVALRQRLERG